MSDHRNRLETTSKPAAWTWHVMPALIVVAALNTLFGSPGIGSADANATAALGAEEATAQAWLLPASPQPGTGEAALRAQDLAQAY